MSSLIEIAGRLDWSPLWISIKTGIVATVISFFLGLWAARKVVKDRKKGVGSCGMNCSSCPYHDHDGCDSKADTAESGNGVQS